MRTLMFQEGFMRALNKVLLALLLVCFLGAVMPVAASTDSPNNYQSEIDWRFVSPKPRPGGEPTPEIDALELVINQPAPLLVVIVDWLLGLVD